MKLLEEFKKYLFSQKKRPSQATVKNYIADIRHFILWFEEQYHVVFQATLINAEHWQQFKVSKRNLLSTTSLERHLSSLRKFFQFFLETNIIQENPFDINKIKTEQAERDPWMIKNFKENLKKDKVSKITIKNYSSDIHQFLSWIEKHKNSDIENNKTILPLLNIYFLEQYKTSLQKQFSQSSIKRKVSSIKKYIAWVKEQQDEYIGDPMKEVPTTKSNVPLNTLTEPILENVLIEDPSINQVNISQENTKVEPKQITYSFLAEHVHPEYFKGKLNLGKNQNDIKSANKNKYSKFPPVRLFQKIFKAINFLIDLTIILPISKGLEKTDYFIWTAKGKPVFSKRLFILPKLNIIPIEKLRNIYDIGKEQVVYKTERLKKNIFQLIIPESIRKHRPAWYHKYHSYPIAHYFHFAILVIFMSAIGFNLYNSFFDNANSRPVFAALPTAPPKLLSFQGRLTDKNSNPITTRTNVRFAAYNNSMASGSALLWQEVDNVQPDKNGNISVSLGGKSFLDQNIFSKNNALWLGVTVEQANELHPRQPLATTAYASNAETLQGLLPITNPDAGTKNVVLALDSGGNLTINDNNDHIFQATGGQFILSGNALILGTNPGTSGDVQISPDGFGQIDIQKPIHNTSNYNNIPSALGSVEVDDTFSILASTSGQSAFTLNQNGYGPLISASSSGVAKFTIENDGTIVSAGDLSIKGFVESNLTPFGNSLSLGSNQSQWNNLFVKSIYLDGSPLTQTWQEDADSIYPINQSKNLLIGLTASTSANFEVVASSGAILTQGDITLIGHSSAIGTTDNQTLHIGNAETGAVAISPKNQAGLFVDGNGSVGIGTQTLPDNTALHISKDSGMDSLVVADQHGNGNIFSGSVNGNIKFNIANNGDTTIKGTIYASNTTVQSADLAENYIASDKLEPGDIIIPENKGNNLGVVKSTSQYQSQVIGVLSTKPGVVLNSDAETDSAHPYKYPIAISGRVPVKVSIANGVVKTGDLLTSSVIPGVAMKATEAGPIIGKALEDFSSEKPGLVMAYISITFGNPSISLADNGNLSIANQLFSNLNIDQKNVIQKFIDEIANGTELTLTKIFANIISAKQVISETVLAKTLLLAPVANIDEVHSNLLSPLSEAGKIALSLNNNSIQIHNGNTASSAAVTTFDNQGNATFSGQVNSNNLAINNDATISGTLHAGKIIASQIEGLPTASTSSQYITNVTNYYNATAAANTIVTNDKYLDIASYSAQFANVPTLHTDSATIEQGLVSLGPTSLSDTSITGQLSIGSQFVFSNNSINVLGGDLELQPLKQGGIAIAGRQLYIDNNGNITANGNATFNGVLAANTIKPIKDRDLTVNLDNGNTNSNAANFKVTNASNSAIFNVNQIGDIIASGAATINKLNFTITKPALALSDHEIIASGSAGVATINANQTFVQVDNKLVTDKSLIYITPVGHAGEVPFLLKQVPGSSFTVGLEQIPLRATTFNWLIIN
ncbi:MAG TPA: site-specific integrase [Candidatus Saccharimonadales bacterium]|nr:site-specific integrase [Candidatus Saccharimonadales bacterium]